MKSLKPGRGPSMMGAMGSVAVGIFGIIWTIAALNMGAPVFFPLLGLVFIAIAVVQTIYHYKNATDPERYSIVDIVDSLEEGDPFAHHIETAAQQRAAMEADAMEAAEAEQEPVEVEYTEAEPMSWEEGDTVCFCPYCGTAAEADFLYCKKCGKRLPQ